MRVKETRHMSSKNKWDSKTKGAKASKDRTLKDRDLKNREPKKEARNAKEPKLLKSTSMKSATIKNSGVKGATLKGGALKGGALKGAVLKTGTLKSSALKTSAMKAVGLKSVPAKTPLAKTPLVGKSTTSKMVAPKATLKAALKPMAKAAISPSDALSRSKAGGPGKLSDSLKATATLKSTMKSTSMMSTGTMKRSALSGSSSKVSPLKGAAMKSNSAVSSSALAKPFNQTSPLQDEIEISEICVTVCPEFNVNDKVVYPAHGVGLIDSIEVRKVGGSEHRFYRILFPEAGMKIMVSVNQVQNVGLRKVVDHKTVEEVYGILADRNVVVDTQTWNRRFRDYSQKIKTGSVLEIAKVIRDLSALKTDKELSFGERRMLDTAQGLLVKEISIAKSKSEEIIRAELQSICDVPVAM